LKGKPGSSFAVRDLNDIDLSEYLMDFSFRLLVWGVSKRIEISYILQQQKKRGLIYLSLCTYLRIYVFMCLCVYVFEMNLAFPFLDFCSIFYLPFGVPFGK